MDEDYYKILGAKRDASQAEIQRAYRDLARRYHPDMNPGDEKAKEKFQRVQRAYDVLNNPEKREMYDRYGSSFESMGAGGPGANWKGFHGGQGGAEEFDFSQLFGGRGSEGYADIFRQFTGGRGRGTRAAPQRGADISHEIEIPFGTSISGGEANLSLRRPGGNVENITVKIPQGIQDGQKIRVRGQGQAAPGGAPGDILIQVHVAPHPCFRRRHNNLEVTVPITLLEAAVGAKIDVPTPKGTITLTVPPGTSSGRRLRIKGHGVERPKGSPGDLYVELQIVLPKKLDAEAQQQIREICDRHPLNPRTELRW